MTETDELQLFAFKLLIQRKIDNLVNKMAKVKGNSKLRFRNKINELKRKLK